MPWKTLVSESISASRRTVVSLPEPPDDDKGDSSEEKEPADNDEGEGRAVLWAEVVVSEAVVRYAPADDHEEEGERSEEGGENLASVDCFPLVWMPTIPTVRMKLTSPERRLRIL